jgi:hypothetical protein
MLIYVVLDLIKINVLYYAEKKLMCFVTSYTFTFHETLPHSQTCINLMLVSR